MAISKQQQENFFQDGFLILPNFFKEQDLVPLKKWISRLVDELAIYLIKEGAIKNTYESFPFLTRLAMIEKEYPLAAVCIHSLGDFSEELYDFASHKPLHALIKSLLGADPSLHPVWNIRAKTPHNPLATVPWHQDTAYLASGSEKVSQITTWVPLLDVDLKHGPLVFVKGGHHEEMVYPHHLEKNTGHPDSWYLRIEEEHLPIGERIVCQVPEGSLIVFNQLVPHCCLENASEDVRWTIDLRWQDPSLSNGMGASKKCIKLSSSNEQWKEWGKQKRPGQKQDSYNPSISGPWLDRWKT